MCVFVVLLLRRAVAVELEVTKELNKLLHSVESMYLSIVREVVEYAVANNVTSATQLQGLFYSKYRSEYPSLNSQLVIQAIRQAAQIAKSFVKRRKKGLASKPYPEVRRVSIRFTEKAWGYEQFIHSIAPVRLELSLPNGRTEVWLRPHKRFWLYWWRVLRGEAELASTLIVKRRANKWYAIFVFELKPRVEEPKSIIAFDINENTVAVSRVDLPSTVDRVVCWNRQYMIPELYTIRTDFGRLARRYERVRNAIIERLKPEFALPNGKCINITNTREYRKRVRKLREGDRKVGRVRHVASELTKTPAIIVTEDLGDNPQESMINEIRRNKTRHRIKQIPFKALERAVEEKALERGSKLFRVSAYRNSRVCPIHFVKLEETNDWHTLQCTLGHYVDRDHASVLNMAWKVTPEGWVKGVWWDLRKKMEWGEHEGKSNPIIPYTTVQHLHAILKSFMASEECPAMLARGCPMNPAGEADEGWARKPPKKEEARRITNIFINSLKGWLVKMSLDVSKYLQSPPSVTASDMVGIIVNMYFTVSRKVSAFMLGPPGVGKSQSVEEAADAIAIMLSSLSQQLSYIAYTKFTDAMKKCSADERGLLQALADESGITRTSQGKNLDDVVLETLIKNIRRIAILALVRSPLVFANINLKEGNTYTGIMDFVIPTAMINQVIGTDVFPPYSETLISEAKLLFPTLGMNERLRSTLATSLISDEYMRVSGATTLFSDVINAFGSCRGIIGLFFAFARLFKQGITYETLKSLIKMRLDRKVVETFDSYFYLFEPPYQRVAQQFKYPVSSDMTELYSHEYMPASCDYFAVNKNLTLMSMGVRRVLITANGEIKFDAELGDLYVPYTALPVYEELRDIYNFLSRYREFLNIGIHKYGETHIEEPFEKSLAGAKVCLFNYLDFRLSQLELEDIKGVPSDIAARYLALVLFGERGETKTYEKGGEQAAQKIKEEVFKYLTLPYSVVRSLESTKAVWLAPPWLLREGFGILFLDELNLAPYYMQAAAYQIVLDRRISTGHELSSGIFVIAAGNNVDWASEIAKELPYPLRNRFAIFYVYVQPYSFLEWATYYANIMPTLLKMYLGTIAMGGETGVKTIHESMTLLERPWSPEMYGENYILVTPRSFEMASYMINLTAYNTARVVTSNPLLFASPETKSLGEIVSDINKSGDVVSAMINDMAVRLATVSPSVFTYLMQSIILRASSVLGVDYGAQFALALLSGGLLSAMQVLGLNLLASLSPDKVKERPVGAIQEVVGCLANIGRAFAPLSALLSIPNIKEKIRGLFISALSIAGPNASLFTEELIAMLDSIYGIYNINERKTYSDVANDVANHLAIMINLVLSTLTAYAFTRRLEDYYYLIRAYLVSKLFEETLRAQQQQQAQPQAPQLPESSRTIMTSLLYGASTGEPLSSILLSLIQAREFMDAIENVATFIAPQRKKGLRAVSEATGPIEMLKKELKEKPNMWNVYKYFVEAFGGAEGPYIRAWNDRLKVAVSSVCPNLTSYM